jgi:hypothetical protein
VGTASKEEEDNWWAVVRRDLEQAQARMEREIAWLEAQVERLGGG